MLDTERLSSKNTAARQKTHSFVWMTRKCVVENNVKHFYKQLDLNISKSLYTQVTTYNSAFFTLELSKKMMQYLTLLRNTVLGTSINNTVFLTIYV